MLSPITCAKYDPISGTKRCRHYLPNGACSLPDELMCVEWLKANGHTAPAVPTPPPIERDLFGAPVAQLAAPDARPRTPAATSPVSPAIAHAAPAVNAAALASFQALGVEVRLESDDLGELWLVPKYTGADRLELSLEHAALLATLCSALPSARITALVRTPRSTST